MLALEFLARRPEESRPNTSNEWQYQHLLALNIPSVQPYQDKFWEVTVERFVFCFVLFFLMVDVIPGALYGLHLFSVLSPVRLRIPGF